MRFILLTFFIILSNSLSANIISKENLEFFKNKHLSIINSECSSSNNKKDCFINNTKNFYLSLNLLGHPNGQKYYLRCFNENKFDNGKIDYKGVNVCSQNYNNILSYDFLEKKYNYIFLEENRLIQALSVYCTTNLTNEGNLDLMNRCISDERNSFRFFKANYFTSSNKNVEEVFGYCLEKHSQGNYLFKFSKINSCIKKNTYNF